MTPVSPVRGSTATTENVWNVSSAPVFQATGSCAAAAIGPSRISSATSGRASMPDAATIEAAMARLHSGASTSGSESRRRRT
jgi:hypothetical protein